MTASTAASRGVPATTPVAPLPPSWPKRPGNRLPTGTGRPGHTMPGSQNNEVSVVTVLHTEFLTVLSKRTCTSADLRAHGVHRQPTGRVHGVPASRPAKRMEFPVSRPTECMELSPADRPSAWSSRQPTRQVHGVPGQPTRRAHGVPASRPAECMEFPAVRSSGSRGPPARHPARS